MKMIRWSGGVLAAVLSLLAANELLAQTASSDDPGFAAQREELINVETNRETVVSGIVDQWRSQLRSAVPSMNIADEAEMLTAALQRAPVEKLLAASEAQTYEEALAALNGRWQWPPSGIPLPPGSIPNVLGDTGADLVFTPVTPCRIVDTRLATGGWAGRIGPNLGNWFSVNLADYSAQGGFAGSCGFSTAFDVSGVVLNVTSTDQTGNGNLRVKECGGGTPLVSLVNYQPGVNLANATATRSAIGCTLGPGGSNDIFIFSGVSASHVVVDIMGYYAAPEATMPDQWIQSTGAVDINPGTQSIFTATCPTGYRLTGGGGGVNSSNFDVEFISTRPVANDSIGLVSGANAGTQYICQYRNDEATAQSVYCWAICSRIPGR